MKGFLNAESQYGDFSYRDSNSLAISGDKDNVTFEDTATEDTYGGDFPLDDELECSTIESEDEFDSELCQDGPWEENAREAPQELYVPNDKEWWKRRMRRI